MSLTFQQPVIILATQIRISSIFSKATILSCLFLMASFPAKADPKLDLLLERFEKLERRTQALEQENILLKKQLGEAGPKEIKTKQSYLHKLPDTTNRLNQNIDHLSQPQVVSSNQVIPPFKQWNGLYVGVNAGFGLNDVNYTGYTVGTGGGSTNTGGAALAMQSGAQYFGGPLAGAQIGYNHQFSNNFILGLEADLDWADINNNYINPSNNSSFSAISTPGTSLASSAFAIGVSKYDGRTGLDWLGTARIRLGYAIGNFMPFISGGFSYGQLSSSASSLSYGYGVSGNVFTKSGDTGSASYSIVRAGWALGAGAEYMVAENWSVKGEYLYTQLQGSSANGLTGGYAYINNAGTITNLAGASYTDATLRAFGIHQARVGINYHTNWLRAEPLISSKY